MPGEKALTFGYLMNDRKVGGNPVQSYQLHKEPTLNIRQKEAFDHERFQESETELDKQLKL